MSTRVLTAGYIVYSREDSTAGIRSALEDDEVHLSESSLGLWRVGDVVGERRSAWQRVRLDCVAAAEQAGESTGQSVDVV